ncbi:MAG: putative metal-binding motif-containing protein, partial [Deltaproteobacteria bacterium]|nr:putative metal-binding motif-containing protein [Deltaproteobacteria bacterium]
PYDDNCNGKTNEKDALNCDIFYFDNDGDTYYASGAETQCWCDPYEKFTGVSSSDCNDGNAAVNPSADENCSTGYDDNCNGQTDEQNAVNCVVFYYDGDGDNYGTNDSQCWCAAHGKYKAAVNGDCDDNDPGVHPGASVCGKDADCDGKYGDPGEACDDGNSARWDGCHQCSIEEFVVNATLSNNQENPTLTAFSNGEFLVVWESWLQDGSASGIFGQRYNADGSKKGSEFQANTYTSSSQINGRVAVLSGDGFVIVWNSFGQDGSQESVHGQMYNADGTKKGGEFQINAYTTNSQTYPDVAALAGGKFVVLWQSSGQDGASWGVYGQRFNSDGAKDGAEFQVNTYTSSEQSRPSVASFGDSSFVVVWQSYGADSSEFAVAGQLFDSSGAKSGNEFIVNTTSANDQKFPSVSSESSGKFVVVWQSYSAATSADILGQRFNAGGSKAGSELTANTFTFSDQESPHVSMSGDGSFNVFWTSWWQDGSGEGVYGQRYNADGAKKGNEFKVNIYTSDSQRAVRSALFPDGKFGAVWSSTSQFDGTIYDIMCQRYSSAGTKIYR